MRKLTAKNFIYLFIFTIFFCFVGIFSINAQSNSSDAIAVRVMPNFNHYSALTWYKINNFTGSPQSLTVDGYEAVRDGRTVYANVANVDSGNLYTNIYLISYNQEAESATIDIFGEILKHWKFNINATGFGVCVKEASGGGEIINCQIDDDCPIGDYCDSNKARIIRDTRRLSDLADINTALESYHIIGNYPKLGAGTYLPNRTMSVWPSWQETLSKNLNLKLPIDPVNELGDCSPASGYASGFNANTCWNETTKQYADNFFALPNINVPEMPKNSLAYTYRTDLGGNAKEVCAVFESGLVITGDVPCGLPVCIDHDGDGYGLFDSGDPGICDYVGADCDDTDPSIHSSTVPEDCSNGADDDCDGWVDCADSDCVAAPACVPPSCDGLCNGVCSSLACSIAQDPDCGCGADSSSCCPAGCTPTDDPDCAAGCVPSGCGDGCPPGCAYPADLDCSCVDGDGCCSSGCDISTDNDCAPVCTDADGDGFYAINAVLCPLGDDCDDTVATGFPIHPGALEVCDGIDNDCNAGTNDGSGEVPPLNSNQNTICAGSVQSCLGGVWTDDYSGVSNYEATETSCSDGNDNDCDTLVDGLDPDCSGTCFGVFINESQWYIASEDPDCNQCDYDGDNDGDQPGVWPPGAADLCDSDCGTVSATVQIGNYEAGNEVSCDGIDNDCDGSIDEALTQSCYTGPPATRGVGDCQDGTQICSAGSWGTCAGEVLPVVEVCDGYDNDCDGSTDEGCDDDGDGYCDTGMQMYNNNSMCPNTPFVLDGQNGDDCDDDPLICGASCNPGISENTDAFCSDTYDNNCNGVIDCADSPSCDLTAPCSGAGTCTFTFTFPCTFP